MSMLHWIWLATRPHCSVRFLNAVLKHFQTPEAVWEADSNDLNRLPRMNERRKQSLLEKDFTHARIIAEECERQNIQIVTQAEKQYPKRLKQIADPPILLYVRGTLPDFNQYLPISIVGTRRCSPYGLRASRFFAGKLALNDCIIVSGMALGIDGEANRAAIEAGGKTIAVLGCGVDVCYPASHQELMEGIISHGAVISEYPPGTEPRGYHFPIRNRIITGLSEGTLIVEAPSRSGALISASLALEQGRDVFAVPGNINHTASRGCNNLIIKGEAYPIQEPEDILSVYGRHDKSKDKSKINAVPSDEKEYRSNQRPIRRRKPELNLVKEKKNTGAEELKLAAASLYEAEKQKHPTELQQSRILKLPENQKEVWLAIDAGNNTVDKIVQYTGLQAAAVNEAITMLEIAAYIIRVSSGYRTVADKI